MTDDDIRERARRPFDLQKRVELRKASQEAVAAGSEAFRRVLSEQMAALKMNYNRGNKRG